MSDDIIKQLKKKYTDLGENHLHYLSGLFHSKPITYWDYVEVDTLLSLQKPRTDFKDETVFIIYHQVTELVLKLMIHEIKQIVFEENLNEPIFKDKLKRLIRYTEMLITSFDVMKDGMSYEDYNKFRLSLTPASGFQSAQFRFLEIYCTPLINLVHQKKQKLLPDKPNIDDFFEHIYWRAKQVTIPKMAQKR
ncbi:tryptophan 2,3-dioxygenase family protein [Flavobacterium sp. CS20]|uniref:tryptophan 2,3-dioxygenase family protein n=1 Tax=Flavobacterium sp. CS20 TaxID=2775246 RepID=UPI0035302946